MERQLSVWAAPGLILFLALLAFVFGHAPGAAEPEPGSAPAVAVKPSEPPPAVALPSKPAALPSKPAAEAQKPAEKPAAPPQEKPPAPKPEQPPAEPAETAAPPAEIAKTGDGPAGK